MTKTTKSEIEEAVYGFFNALMATFSISSKIDICRAITENLQDTDGNASAYPEDLTPTPQLQCAIKNNGFIYGGSGATRLCLFYKNLAIKIEKAHPGQLYGGSTIRKCLLNENKNELDNYVNIISSYPLMKICMSPIIHSFSIANSNIVLVMPLLTSYHYTNFTEEDEYNADKEALIRSFFADTGSANYGIYQNETFLLDYNVEDNEYDDYNRETAKKAMVILGTHKERVEQSKVIIREMEQFLA